MDTLKPYLDKALQAFAPALGWLKTNRSYVLAGTASIVTFGAFFAVTLFLPPRTVVREEVSVTAEPSRVPEAVSQLEAAVADLRKQLADEQAGREQLRADFQAATKELAANHDLLTKHGENVDAAIKEINAYVRSQPKASAGSSSSSASAPAAASGKVNINTATAAQLDSLPGIGPSYAERIVQYRADNGPFTSVDQLGNVPGIGPATLDKIRGSIEL